MYCSFVYVFKYESQAFLPKYVVSCMAVSKLKPLKLEVYGLKRFI